jgi:hypothetical protein
MANQLNITLEEAIKLLEMQDTIGILGATLEEQEGATFAGLWVQYEPEYRVVVAFTQNGEQTIRPYVENTSLAGLIEIQPAEATLAELHTAQREAAILLNALEFPAASEINVHANQVELFVTDRLLFEASLLEAQAHLPDHVIAITIYEPLNDEPPFAVTSEPTIHFPQLMVRSPTNMLALLVGDLILDRGCLRVDGGGGSPSLLVIWQPDYFLNNNEGGIEILNRTGEVVARVGEEVRMGGGQIELSEQGIRQLREPLPIGCTGPYWLLGEVVSDD